VIQILTGEDSHITKVTKGPETNQVLPTNTNQVTATLQHCITRGLNVLNGGTVCLLAIFSFSAGRSHQQTLHLFLQEITTQDARRWGSTQMGVPQNGLFAIEKSY
jgi:hypothetical protein